MSTQVIVAGPRNGITIEKIENEIMNSKPLTVVKDSGKSYNGKKNITIEGFDFRVDEDGGKQCAVTDCENVTIRRCIFGNKKTLGQALNIVGSKTKKVIVEFCIFENMSYTEANGAEPLRLGTSDSSGCIFECIVRNCIFRNLNSDPENISIKSCKNIIEDNFFINNKSNVTVRHGGLATIRHNYFRGRGGVRLHGYGNKVLFNCFEGHGVEKFVDKNGKEEKFEDSWYPIVLRYGNAERDPNFIDVKTPSGNKGKSHAIYAHTVNNEINGNEFKNCNKTVIELEKGGSIKPKDTIGGLNPTVNAFKFGTVNTTTPAPTEPEDKPPVDPETEEQPVITPQPDDASDTHMCGIYRHDEAKVHLHIYACSEHAPTLISKFKRILKETEDEVNISVDRG